MSEIKPVNKRERLHFGRLERKRAGRSALAKLHPKKRLFNPIDLLRSTHEGRILKLLPIKYQRMAASPFAFFRGSVGLMAADLAALPHTNLSVQLCGDAHVQNMGSFEAPDGRIVFDMNDFDETIMGPFEWDVKRMATSLVLAGLESGHQRSECAGSVRSFVGSYCALLQELAAEPVLVAARHQIRRPQKVQAVSAALKQAERATPGDLVAKYTELRDRKTRVFKHVKNVLWPVEKARRQQVIEEGLAVYRESLSPDRLHLLDFFRPLDVAFKIVGTGSVGLRDYVVLLEGNGPDDALFLQFKQEVPSAYAAFLPSEQFAHQGRRVAEGQRKIQPLSDPLLGWARIGGHDYLVRQLDDHKGSIDLGNLAGRGLTSLATIAGELLARGHARSGDPVVLAGYIGAAERMVEAMEKFALAYSDQVEADFKMFQKAIHAGRLRVANDG